MSTQPVNTTNTDSSQQLAYRLCLQYGFDTAKRQQRLVELQLTTADEHNLAELQREVIQPHHKQVMDDFYSFILTYADLRMFVKNDEHIQRLKQTQTEYLLSLGCDFTSADYFEYRLRVGVAHARIEMPLSKYIVAYNYLRELLYAHMLTASMTDRHFRSLNKILMLDISLATDAYNLSQFKWLSDSIDQLKVEQSRLTNQLMHDTLTNAYSRAYILEQLEKRLAEFNRDSRKHVAIALIDLDKFKDINDTYGHQAGDQVLQEFSHTIMQMIRRQDYFGRYGGEEFLLVFVDLDQHRALELAERIRHVLAAKTYIIQNNEIHVTASLGMSVAQSGETATMLIDRADRALYQAKKSGRNKTILINEN